MAEAKLKIRISLGMQTAMGPGKADLLETIQRCGSISAAAKEMKMSYRRAWELVDAMNHCFAQPLVHSVPGGGHGSGAHVTATGLKVLKSYRDLESRVQLACEKELQGITDHLAKDRD